METKKNGFASGIGFVLSAAGSAVGLGNLWGFPYKTAENGGAAFVLIYIVCVLLIGVATMLCEFHIGRRAAANPVTAYKRIHKNVGWFGLIGVAIPAFIICYYSVLGGYTVKYTLNGKSRLSVTGITRNASGERWYQLSNGQWISEEYVRYDTFFSFLDWLYCSDDNKEIIYMDGQILFIGE